ncbi:MAG: 50S ribosomal protein L24 [Myxococcales bacterium]|nr:50S ribosomal protein L24 [Myxococcales bacterium]MDH3842722.1 50S ribosomal protein L24 [Myxococcales bacterium]
MTARIKKGDLVQVIAGKDKGEKGRVLQVVRADLLLVEGVNRVKRHQSPRKFREAGIVEKEMPIHASNVMLVDPKTDEPTRIRIEADKKDADKRVRVAVKSGSVLD